METKLCAKCNTVKPITEFAKAKNCVGGYRRQCRPCRSSVIRDWKKRTGYKPKPEAVQKKKETRVYPGPKINRRYGLYSKYRMTHADYERLLAKQGGVCALCRVEGRSNRWRRLSVDHCHETGRFRGLLCAACNTALGMLGDSIESIRRALDYVEGNLFDVEEIYVPIRNSALRKQTLEIAPTPDNP